MKILLDFIETPNCSVCTDVHVTESFSKGIEKAQYLEGVSKTLLAQNTCNRRFTSSLKCLSSVLFSDVIGSIARPGRLSDKEANQNFFPCVCEKETSGAPPPKVAQKRKRSLRDVAVAELIVQCLFTKFSDCSCFHCG